MSIVFLISKNVSVGIRVCFWLLLWFHSCQGFAGSVIPIKSPAASSLSLRTQTNKSSAATTTTTTTTSRCAKQQQKVDNLPFDDDGDDGYNNDFKKYNDLAFGFVSLGSLVATNNLDFAATFVGLSALVAALAEQNVFATVPKKLLPALTAAATAILFPIVSFLHQYQQQQPQQQQQQQQMDTTLNSILDIAASSKLEFGLCLVSILVAIMDSQISTRKTKSASKKV